MRVAARLTFGLLALVSLTVITQVGGIALLVCWLLGRMRAVVRMPGFVRAGVLVAVFIAAYGALSWFVVPALAALGGRVPLPCRADADRPFRAGHLLYCGLNRHYVDARLLPLLTRMSRDMDRAYPGTVTLFLDANFPFLNGFPLLPHLSHDDGRKLDLAFYYAAPDGTYLPGAMRSPIGYWAFETPRAGDPLPCSRDRWLTLRWDVPFLQRLYPDGDLEPERTRTALAWLASEGARHGVERIFVEPHLARRLGVTSPLIGFQGCRAARHDDHIHVQIGR
jgi:hypothetical protein